jgi:hypothetical protein
MLSKELATMILQQFDQSALRVIQTYFKAKTNELDTSQISADSTKH